MMFFGRSARTQGTHVNQKRKIIMIIIKILTRIQYISTIRVFRHRRRRRLVSPVLYFFLKVYLYVYYIIMCVYYIISVLTIRSCRMPEMTRIPTQKADE